MSEKYEAGVKLLYTQRCNACARKIHTHHIHSIRSSHGRSRVVYLQKLVDKKISRMRSRDCEKAYSQQTRRSNRRRDSRQSFPKRV